MVVKNCVICGKEFDAKGNTITCSKECSEENNKEKMKERNRQYCQDNKEKIKEQNRQYYQKNKKYFKQYYQNNKEKIKEQNRQYKQDNKEKIKEQNRRYYQKNKEKIKEHQKQYCQDNKEKIKQYYQDNKEKIKKQKRQYYQNNKEKIIEHQKEYQKKRYEQVYKELSKKYDISIEDLKSFVPPFLVQRELECFDQGSYFLDLFIPARERANGKCEITGKKTNNLVVHHLNGYNWCVEGRIDLDNVVVICEELHDAFHQKHGYGDNTEEQFWKFVEEWKEGIITLDDFMEE